MPSPTRHWLPRVFFTAGLIALAVGILVTKLGAGRGGVLHKLLPQSLILPYFGTAPAQNLTNLLAAAGFRITQPPVETENYLEASVSGVLVFIAKDKDYFESVRTLQIIWNRFTIEGKKPREIDLRFDKAVLRY